MYFRVLKLRVLDIVLSLLLFVAVEVGSAFFQVPVQWHFGFDTYETSEGRIGDLSGGNVRNLGFQLPRASLMTNAGK